MVEPYNSVLHCHYSLEHVDVAFLVDNQVSSQFVGMALKTSLAKSVSSQQIHAREKRAILLLQSSFCRNEKIILALKPSRACAKASVR